MFFSILLFFACCFSVFADYTVSYSYSTDSPDWVDTGYTCPFNAISVTAEPTYDGQVGVGNPTNPVNVNTTLWPGKGTEDTPFKVRTSGGREMVTLSWSVTLPGDDPGPDPDPDPDPEGGGSGGSGGNGGSSSGNWALESSLQDYMSNFQTFSQAFASWASSLLSDVRSGNTKLDTTITQLMGINNQQINDHQQRNELHADMKTYLGPVRDNVAGIKTGVNDLNTKAGMSLTAQNLGNSYLASIDDNTGQIKDKTASIDTKLSGANTNLSDINTAVSEIQNTLKPQGITSPTAPNPMSSLPSGSTFIQTVKSRLLPGYSFFRVSGDNWPSWTVTFSLSYFGMDDLTVVLGGSDWQTVAGGKIVWLASIIRTLSKFAFYLIFLNAVIKALRQW